MRYLLLINFAFLFSIIQLDAQTKRSSGEDTAFLNHMVKIADSIVSSHVGEATFKKFYRFAQEYSIIRNDSIGYGQGCSWENNYVGKGTHFEIAYTLQGNTFSFEGIRIFLKRNGTVYGSTSNYGMIPSQVNGAVPVFITRKEALSIATKYGCKDTTQLNFELQTLPSSDSTYLVYRLKIVFDTDYKISGKNKDVTHFTVTTIMVNPWSKKVVFSNRQRVELTPPDERIEIIQDDPPSKMEIKK